MAKWFVEVVTNKDHLHTVAVCSSKVKAHDVATRMMYTKSRPSYSDTHNPTKFIKYKDDVIIKKIYITDMYGDAKETLDCETGEFVKGGTI